MNGVVDAKKQERILYLDCLRILGAFAVILIHVSAREWDVQGLLPAQRRIFAYYNSAGAWAVILFMMLSGALFLDLDRPLDLKKLYGKHIAHLLTAFFIWGVVYAGKQFLEGAPLKTVAEAALYGHYHMWYVFMAIAYYMAVPVFREVIRSKKITEYFLAVTFLWAFLIPCLITYSRYFQIPHTATITEVVWSWHNAANFAFPRTYGFYFVYGLYLHKYDISSRLRKWMPAALAVGYLGRALPSAWYVSHGGVGGYPFDFAIFDLLTITALFNLCKYALSCWQPGPRQRRWICTLSGATFGIYMIHALVLDGLFDGLGFSVRSFSPVLSIPVFSLAAMGISFCLVWLLQKIPFMRKYAL